MSCDIMVTFWLIIFTENKSCPFAHHAVGTAIGNEAVKKEKQSSSVNEEALEKGTVHKFQILTANIL